MSLDVLLKRFFFSPFVLSALLLAGGATLPAGVTAESVLVKLAGSASPAQVVTTDQVRAELLAWAPEGVEAGKPANRSLSNYITRSGAKARDKPSSIKQDGIRPLYQPIAPGPGSLH